jgi:hypothetical protein
MITVLRYTHTTDGTLSSLTQFDKAIFTEPIGHKQTLSNETTSGHAVANAILRKMPSRPTALDSDERDGWYVVTMP